MSFDTETAHAQSEPADTVQGYKWTLESAITHFEPEPGSGDEATVKEQGEESDSYRKEKLTVRTDPCDCEARTNFTVVRVDVEMQGLGEDEEESEGGLVGYNGDDDNANGTPDREEEPVPGENDLIPVLIAIYPAGLPADEEVAITASEGGVLYEDPEKTAQAAAVYTVGDLPLELWLEGKSASSQLRDHDITVEHLPSGAKDKVKYTLLKIDIEYPFDTDGNGLIDDPDNEFSFDMSDPAVLQIGCQAFNSPGADPNKLHWTIEDIGDVEGVWNPHIDSDEHVGKGLNPTVTFTGMPEHNSDFGPKKITLTYDGLSCTDEEYIEVFFEPLGLNNPGPPPQNPPGEISEEDLVE